MRPSVISDIKALLKTGLRSADLLELETAGFTPEEALTHGYSYSKPFCLTITVDKEPVAMFGVADDLRYPEAKAGLIWLLGTEKMLEIKRQFLRESRKWLGLISQDYQVVGNHVHKDNGVHITWLSWLGFTFIGELGPFLEFTRITDVQQQTDSSTEPERSSEQELGAENASDLDRDPRA